MGAKVHLSLVTVGRSVSQEHGLLGYGGRSTRGAGCLGPANQLGCHWRRWKSELECPQQSEKSQKKDAGVDICAESR